MTARTRVMVEDAAATALVILLAAVAGVAFLYHIGLLEN